MSMIRVSVQLQMLGKQLAQLPRLIDTSMSSYWNERNKIN